MLRVMDSCYLIELLFDRKFCDKYGKILIDTATKTVSKRVVQETEETAEDLIKNKKSL